MTHKLSRDLVEQVALEEEQRAQVLMGKGTLLSLTTHTCRLLTFKFFVNEGKDQSLLITLLLLHTLFHIIVLITPVFGLFSLVFFFFQGKLL